MFVWKNRFLCQMPRFQPQYNVHEYRHRWSRVGGSVGTPYVILDKGLRVAGMIIFARYFKIYVVIFRELISGWYLEVTGF
jgi:hypothetical protein